MNLDTLCLETMKLEYITRDIKPLRVKGSSSCDIIGMAYDSRRVRPGYMFFALPGLQHDGTEYIEQAIQKGAIAVVSESEWWAPKHITHIQVEDARQAMAEISCAFYNRPSSRMAMVGITGTNGKTTTAYMVRAVLQAAHQSPGLIGTIQYDIGNRHIPAGRTTPESSDIQSMLDNMLQAGCKSAVMEVSSHGLVQKRVWGIDFDVGVFTNLTRDHLDYHKSMENYFAAKSMLFQELGIMEKQAHAVINIDDPWGLQLANTNGFNARCITYGEHPNAMVRAEAVKLSESGCDFMLATPWGERPVHLPLLGRFSVHNGLAAIATGCALGVSLEVSAAALNTMDVVPGRMEKIENGQGLQVFVDYAHTDDALSNVLSTVKEITRGRIILVFGCGGNRDTTKRPAMGTVASRMADYTVITSDNPRNENPMDICNQIAEGFHDQDSYRIVTDRREAIAEALSMAGPDDIVLIAGKGHETSQEINNTVVPFDDRHIISEIAGEI